MVGNFLPDYPCTKVTVDTSLQWHIFLLIVLSMMDDRVMNWSKTCALVNSTHFSSGKVRW